MTRLFAAITFCIFMAMPCFAQDAQTGKLMVLRQPIDMNYGASPRFAVIFNHNTHKSVKCKTCHHIKTANGKRFVNCTVEGCHSTPGARLRNPESMFMAYHARDTDRSCYGCHKMEAAKYPQFKGCRPCHMSMLTRQQQAAEKVAAKN